MCSRWYFMMTNRVAGSISPVSRSSSRSPLTVNYRSASSEHVSNRNILFYQSTVKKLFSFFADDATTGHSLGPHQIRMVTLETSWETFHSPCSMRALFSFWSLG